MMEGLILFSMIFPALSGIILLISSFKEHLSECKTIPKPVRTEKASQERHLHFGVGVVLTLSVLSALTAVWTKEGSIRLFTLLYDIPVYFHVDALGRLFVTVVSIVWLLVGFYSFVYMEHEGDQKRYFGFYLLLYAILIGLDLSGNLITMYLFYELMTLISMPLVLHNMSREAIMAALKYLFYSMFGAYAALFGIFFLYHYCDSLTFTAGGTLSGMAYAHTPLLLIAVFSILIGFGVKAGMFPFHAWLWSAHPVAPSPASAVLSGIIVKSGVLAIIRVVYYITGTDLIRGTWVQYTWMTLTLVTIFMGSLLAFREPVFKKRLAYSTVSQVSYILFGLSLMTPGGVTGALLHTVIHAFTKCGLFLTAGIFLFQFGYTRVEQLAGIGKRMPKTMWCYTILALSLIGIPPAGGFISKWYLAIGALDFGILPFSYLGPAILLLSALLTAGYLLPITMEGFFPQDAEAKADLSRKEPSAWMYVPLMLLSAMVLVLGILPNPLIQYIASLAESLLR